MGDVERAGEPAGQQRGVAVRPVSQTSLIGAVVALDTLAVIAAGLLTQAASTEAMKLGFWSGFAVVVAMSGLAVFALGRVWSYTVAALASPVRQFTRVALAFVAIFAGLASLDYALGTGGLLPRSWIIAWLTAAFLAVVTIRLVVVIFIRRWTAEGRLARRAVVVGGGRPTEDLIRQLRATAGHAIRICGVFDDRNRDRSADPAERYRVIGGYDEMVDFCRAQAIDLIIVALPATAEERILQILKKLWVLPIDVRVSAHQSKLRLRSRAYSYIGNVPFLAVFDKPLSDWNWAIKEIEDRLVAVVLLILLSPVMLAVAVAVKATSKGPVFFRQKRHGFNNRLIDVYKFRSMYTDMADATAARLVTRDDPRVTPVGRFIRKTSLDELPQLFNVLRGDLSLVGPRPHATQAKAGSRIYQDVVDGYCARHRMKPGITGLAQISGWRGETDTEEKIQRRVEHDIQYIDNWSIWLDLYILIMTPVSLLNAKNAY
jgi:Undecaprenyl-phosphate glucose phosphotransferase